MKPILMSFKQFILMIKKDKMLLMICFIPLLCGIIFRFGFPIIYQVLMDYLHFDILPYTSLIDMFYAILISEMFCIVAALVILEERDDHIINSLFITPLGKVGYLLSRLGVPTLISFIMTCILLPIFHLSSISFHMWMFICVLGCLQGTIVSLLVVSLSSHKLEGMAMAKIASLESFVILIPYFIQDTYSYLLAWVPSFWIGKGLINEQVLFTIMGLLVSILWIVILIFVFKRKLA